MTKNLYNFSSVVVSNATSANVVELTSIDSPSDFVASEDLMLALENSSPNVQAAFMKVLVSSSTPSTNNEEAIHNGS